MFFKDIFTFFAMSSVFVIVMLLTCYCYADEVGWGGRRRKSA